MALLAQIADIFSQESWNLLLVCCLASPLLGAIVNVFIRGITSRRDAAIVLAGYYSLVSGLYFVITHHGEPLAACLALYFSLLLGPLLGLSWLLEIQRAPKMTQTPATDD